MDKPRFVYVTYIATSPDKEPSLSRGGSIEAQVKFEPHGPISRLKMTLVCAGFEYPAGSSH